MKRKIKETGSGYQMQRNPSKSWHMNLAHPFSKVPANKGLNCLKSKSKGTYAKPMSSWRCLKTWLWKKGLALHHFIITILSTLHYLCIISVITPAGGEGSIIGLVSGSLIPNCVYQPLFNPHHLTLI